MCPVECVFGTCTAGNCICEENFFGRLCDKKIYMMSDDLFREVTTLEAHEALYFREDTNEGEKEIRFDLNSIDKPKMMFIVNEDAENETKFLTRQIPKGSDKSIDFFMLEVLESSGEERRSFVAEARWVYMTYINFTNQQARIDLKITSNPPLKILNFLTFFSRN